MIIEKMVLNLEQKNSNIFFLFLLSLSLLDFLLMAASAVSNNTNNLNATNLMRAGLTANTSPITANNGISNLNSTGNSVCSSLSSNNNSGSTSLKLMLNNQSNNTTANLLSPSSNSAPSDNFLGDINYLSELFNTTSLSPILGNSSASLNNSSQNLNLNCNNLMNNSLNGTINPIKSNVAQINRHFNPTSTASFLDMNVSSFGNFGNMMTGKTDQPQFNNSTQQEINGQSTNQSNQTNQQSTSTNQPQPNNSPKSTDTNNEKQFNDSFSMSNGVIYPNQYQHLLVAN